VLSTKRQPASTEVLAQADVHALSLGAAMDETEPVEERAHVPLVTVVASIAALWLFYFATASLRGVAMEMGHQVEMLWPRLLVTFAGMAVTLGLWLLMRPFDNRSLGVRITVALVAALPASVLIAQINELAFARLEQQVIKLKDRQGSVRIIRDQAGNILVDIPERPQVPAPPDPPAPPAPTTDPASPPAPAAPTPPTVPAPPIVTEEIVGPPVIAVPKGKTVITVNGEKGEPSRWQELTDIALARYFLLVAWAALYQALLAGERARVAERREGDFRRAAKAAELRSLRYQVNPHFLFNTLNSLSALVLTGKAEKAEQMIQTISRFYRRSLTEDPTGDVRLADEVAQQRLYLEIEEVRFPHRLRTEIDLPGELESACVPGMILQPLVENSVKYAVAATSRPVTIRIAAHANGDRLVLSVADDGPGTVQTKPSPSGYGIGLDNVRQRLAARFGAEAALVSGPTGQGYHTVITLPWVRHDQ